MSIVELVDTKWLARYYTPIEITYDQVFKCIGYVKKIPD